MSAPRSLDDLGPRCDSDGVDFAVFSSRAEAMSLCLFDAAGAVETGRLPMRREDGGIFRLRVEGLKPGARYGLRADGPFAPELGARFDPAKLLADPFATRFDRPYALAPGALDRGHDDAAGRPKAIVEAPPAIAPEPGRARLRFADSVTYELNLRGFSATLPGLDPALRGRFAALASPPALAHFRRLGITTVEIMPAAIVCDEPRLTAMGLANAWGYNPAVFGAPDPRMAPGGFAEVRAATDALHAAGFEVVLDVVLNHTAESDEAGPTLSLRGLDDGTYYRKRADDPARYVDDCGTGNCVALDRPPVMAMALACLRRWMALGGIDGFRFDLATALGRRDSGFDPAAPMIEAIRDDPTLSRGTLIAEPWDVGPGGYALGRFPREWGEWNDRFRDDVRRFWRGDPRSKGALATRLAGSSDVFAAKGSPARSVNFVAAHDGFTLADLVSFAAKHNQANGEDGRDGTDDDNSWNHGVEGPSADARVRAERAADVRSLLLTTLASRGAPMIGMGDELGRTQDGNNNAYAQPGPISRVDWAGADEGLIDFVAGAIRLRRAHRALRDDCFLTGAPPRLGLPPDVEWRGPKATLEGAGWDDPAPFLVAVFCAPAAEGVDRVALVFNAGGEAVETELPLARAGTRWTLALASRETPAIVGAAWTSPARSAAAFVETKEG